MGGGLGDFAKYGSIGISWVLTTSVYLFLGYRGGMWLDARLGTAPVFFILGMVAAVGLSLVSLTKELMALDKGFRRRREQSQGHRTGVNRERKHYPYSGQPLHPEGSDGGAEGEDGTGEGETRKD